PETKVVEQILREFAPVSVVLRFHLDEELDEFRRLTDAVQQRISRVSRVKVKTCNRGFSQPLDGFSALALQCIDAGNVIHRMVVEGILEGMPGKNDRNLGFSGGKIAF